jgi:hypothetical protein
MLADSMTVHNNPDAATLFAKMAGYSELHAAQVRGLAAGLPLPPIAPWAFKWSCPESPEASCMDDAHYLMNRREALELALHNEVRSRDFYAGVAGASPDADVRRMARDMFEEESRHVELLRDWIAAGSPDEGALVDDLDPPKAAE